jgi:hypothetical protein
VGFFQFIRPRNSRELHDLMSYDALGQSLMDPDRCSHEAMRSNITMALEAMGCVRMHEGAGRKSRWLSGTAFDC